MSESVAGPDRASVLVVDDSNLLRGILKEELEAEGFEVHLAEDGEDGLDLARGLRPDAVLLDVGVPRLDGFEVCRRLKADEATSHIPILILSASNELKDKLAGFEAGADDYLAKPFFTKELLARLRSTLRTKENVESSRRLGQHYLEMLFSIGSAITSPFKVDDELDVILRNTLVAVQAPEGAILLLDPAEGMLEVRATAGYDGDRGPRLGARFRISDKLPVLHPEEPGVPLGIRVHEDPARQAAFVPMVAKERLVGGIEVGLGGRKPRLSANEQKILYALASQAAIFIENARLERDVRSMFLSIIVSMASAVDARDAYTHGHSLRVARTSLLLGQQLALPRERMEPLLLAGILHDVGKIGMPDHILKKPGRLNREEFEIMKEHPVAGARMLSHIPALAEVIPGIRHHHEFWDGSGYPDGMAGEAIPLSGRIILVSDALDAMTTDRIYRKGMSLDRALGELRKYAGSQFDPRLVEAFETACREGRIGEATSRTTPTLHELIEQIR